MGTPVDPTPSVIRNALAAASDAPGYPTTHGTVQVREAVANQDKARQDGRHGGVDCQGERVSKPREDHGPCSPHHFEIEEGPAHGLPAGVRVPVKDQGQISHRRRGR